MSGLLRQYRLALETAVVVAVLVAVRAVMWEAGIEGMESSPLASSIISGGVFVMGLVVAGTLSDYRDAERAPTDIASSLYALLRESESIHRTWSKPDLPALADRLVAVVTGLRADIDSGSTRECEAAVEAIGDSLLEMEDTDVPANYVVRLRAEQSALRKAALRVYRIQREEFLPSAKAMITSLVAVIVVMLLFTDMGGHVESLVTVGFLAFFFLYLLRLLDVIDKPFKIGEARTDDDVSLFLLTEFIVHAQVAGQGRTIEAAELEQMAEELEEDLVEAETEASEGAVTVDDLREVIDDQDLGSS